MMQFAFNRNRVS